MAPFLSIATRRRVLATLALVTAGMVGACGSGAPAPAPTPAARTPAGTGAGTAPKILVTIRELMDSTVDPAADGVWEAVGVHVTKAGVERHLPRTEEEWKAVRRHAITLIEAMNLVKMEGRHAAPAGTKPGLGELSPTEIDARIARDRDSWNLYADSAQEQAVKALQAIDAKNVEALYRVGGDLDQRCEACHVAFWYPNAQRPAE